MHLCTGTLLSHESEQITPLTAAWMDRVITLLSKVSQRQISQGITEYILETNANFRYYNRNRHKLGKNLIIMKKTLGLRDKLRLC